MRAIRLLLASLVLTTASVMLPASPAAACSCAGAPFEINEDFGHRGIEEYDAVFVGSVLGSTIQGDETAWQFEIDYLVRGELATPITIMTASDGAACGFEFLAEGDERAVGVRERAGRWESGLCSIDMPEAVAHISFRAEPTLAPADTTESDDGGLSSGDGLGLGLVALGFVAVLGAAVAATRLSRK